jgi:hypothetical protein
MMPGIGDIVSVNGVRCRVRHVAGDRVWLIVLDPVSKTLRDELLCPVPLSDLDAPKPAAGFPADYTQ